MIDTKIYEIMGLSKKIETIIFQIDSFSTGRADLEDMARKIKGEWEMEEDAVIIVQDKKRAELNRVIHATRAFDTGLRLFLDKFHHRGINSHSISDYIRDLQKNVTARTGFNQLPGTVAPLIQTEVTDKRNAYCHSSGAFPTKGEADFVISRILDYYVLVLGLEK